MKHANTIINADRSEVIPYDYEDYKAYVGDEVLSLYPAYTVPTHWHDDVEFILVTSGRAVFNINGNIVQVDQGDAMFINAQQLHFFFSDTHRECAFLFAVLHPDILCASKSIRKTLVEPVLRDTGLQYLHLSQDVTWQNDIIRSLYVMHQHQWEKTAQLSIQSHFNRIWKLLFERAHLEQEEQPVVSNYRLEILKQILAYLHAHYTEKITLEDIAAAGQISKSSCTTIFKAYLQETPINYLIGYRLTKATELLLYTDKTVTEIAYAVGFSGSSYFTEAFRKNFDQTPTEYRRKVTVQHRAASAANAYYKLGRER